MTFHEKLKQCREARNLSQDDIAEALHVSRQAVSKWENGINQPDIATIVLLSDMFGITADRLLRESEDIVESIPVASELAIGKRRFSKVARIVLAAAFGAMVLFALLMVRVQIYPM